MILSLNRGAIDGLLGQTEFAQLAASAGFDECNIDRSCAKPDGAAALAGLFASLYPRIER